MTGLLDIPADHKDCPACKRLRKGLTWTGNPHDPENWPRCPAHRNHGFSEVWQ